MCAHVELVPCPLTGDKHQIWRAYHVSLPCEYDAAMPAARHPIAVDAASRTARSVCEGSMPTRPPARYIENRIASPPLLHMCDAAHRTYNDFAAPRPNALWQVGS